MNESVWECERGTTSSPKWLHSRVFGTNTKRVISADARSSVSDPEPLFLQFFLECEAEFEKSPSKGMLELEKSPFCNL